MAEQYLAWDLLYLEHREGRLECQIQRYNWRELHDPFDLHDSEFVQLYRLTPNIVMELTDILRPNLENRNRINGISPERQVLTALRFYAIGYFQGAIGEQWDIAISQPSVSRYVRKVTDAINNTLLRQWVRFPLTDIERHIAREKFRVAPQPFMGTIGAIDCKYLY
ncbi:PREDICTED: uncharacterized protein LOC108770327 [Trachymyrmex cornetzi]|uniref:uncharacterized protein LOC108770327 n=1 Tax=Trachymyrmex cornetzi TaxID=471704 RepID=UPI00084EDBA6|nr:PREDICTED: uncharacterized protein LOC108770327 [Trachymyrmex cornetzi]